jgi:hypothetical protein
MPIEVRPVGVEAFEDIHPLLLLFPTKEMSKEDWRWTLFTYPWSDSPHRGYAIYADGKAVGFLGTIFSARPLAGRMERVCSLSSWIVLKEYRHASLSLVTPILKLRDCTILNPTPSPVAYEIFSKLGFQPLESERLIVPPLPGIAEAARALSGSIVQSREILESELAGEERTIYSDLSSSPVAQHVLLRRGERKCYVVATPVQRRGIPFAEIQYIGDLDFFWEHRILAHAALLRSTRAMGLWVDSRFAGGRRTPLALRWPAPRLYRPTRKEITPEMIDGLYSEMMGLRW